MDADTLLRAFGLLVDDRPGLTLEFVADGTLEESVRQRAEELGFEDRVQVRTSLPWRLLRESIVRCAVLVLPLPESGAIHQRRLRRVLGEGLARGRPTVALAAGPAAGGKQRSIPAVVMAPDDPVALALVLAQLVDDPPTRVVVGNGRRKPGPTRRWSPWVRAR
jgi:glycosyltransferase involved in cell wall biosynthesis